MEDWRAAPLNERMRAMLGFLEKLTLAPAEVGPADVAPLRAAGLEDEAVEEALYVCFLFNLIDRLADAFNFHIPTEEGFQDGGRFLYKRGYWSSSIPG